MVNLTVCLLLFLANWVRYIFFGDLVDGEVDVIFDKVCWIVPETTYLLTLFRHEFGAWLFGVLFVLFMSKVFHALGKTRVKYLEANGFIADPQHVVSFSYLLAFILISLCIDATLTYTMFRSDWINDAVSAQTYFGFEFCMLAVVALEMLQRVQLHNLGAWFEIVRQDCEEELHILELAGNAARATREREAAEDRVLEARREYMETHRIQQETARALAAVEEHMLAAREKTDETDKDKTTREQVETLRIRKKAQVALGKAEADSGLESEIEQKCAEILQRRAEQTALQQERHAQGIFDEYEREEPEYSWVLPYLPSQTTMQHFLYTIEVVADGLQVCLSMCFFIVVLVKFTAPLHMVHNLYEAFLKFYNITSSYYDYIVAISAIEDELLPATEEDLMGTDTLCIVCREEMTIDQAPRKLGCRHTPFLPAGLALCQLSPFKRDLRDFPFLDMSFPFPSFPFPFLSFSLCIQFNS
jgi:E3 ubiquitin-protein ligase synoviolin